MYRYFNSGPGHGHNKQTDIPYYLQLEQAIVVNVTMDIVDGKSTDVGNIEFIFMIHRGTKLEQIHTARMMNVNSKIYPLKNEKIFILDFLGTYWYFPPLNILGTVNNNSVYGELETEQAGTTDTSATPIPTSSEEEEYELGYDIESNAGIPVLKPYGGDMITQGRFGSNIRIGSNPVELTNKPNIKISMRSEFDDEKFHINEEDLNEDDSIWMTTDEILEFDIKSIPITGDGDTKIKKNTDDVWGGRQITIMSDRLLLQAKEQEIIGYSNLGIHWSCNKNFSIDTDDKIIFNARNNIEYTTEQKLQTYSEKETEILSMKTYIGKIDTENLVIGQEWKAMMIKMLDMMLEFNTGDKSHIHSTGTGPSGPPIVPAPYVKYESGLNEIKSSVDGEEQLSEDNFTTKANR